jgi:hypothetical protein
VGFCETASSVTGFLDHPSPAQRLVINHVYCLGTCLDIRGMKSVYIMTKSVAYTGLQVLLG